MRGAGLAAADRYNDFQFVAIKQWLRGKCTARYDLSVALQCNTLTGITQRFDEFGNLDCSRELARGAVNA